MVAAARPVRLLVGVVVLMAALGAAMAAPAGARSANAGAEADFVDRINGARASAGKGSLVTNGELTSIARRWSQRMADEQRLSHNPNLANEVTQDWEKLAENVGFGQNVAQIHDAFMNSAAHRNNILDGALTHVGVGVVIDGGGQMWVTEVFMRLRGGGGGSAPPPTTAAPPPPPPPTTAAPAPTTAPPATAPPTTRAPRVTTATTARTPSPTTTAGAPPVTAAPPPTTVLEPPPVTPAASAPTPRLVLVLDGLVALDRGR
jgi:hypothetical protein